MERTSMPGFAIEALNSVRQVNLETSARVAADMVSKPGRMVVFGGAGDSAEYAQYTVTTYQVCTVTLLGVTDTREDTWTAHNRTEQKRYYRVHYDIEKKKKKKKGQPCIHHTSCC